MPLSLDELFPDADYRFHLTLRKGSLTAFFRAPDPTILAERSRWLAENPFRYVVSEASAAPLVDELLRLPEISPAPEATTPEGDAVAPTVQLCQLGGRQEPDILLLARDSAGVFRLRAGVVCFPSWWALEEKLGLTLDAIHGVVPGLNPALASPVTQFLERLKPGQPYERANWGLAATPELNLHPTLSRPRLTADTPTNQMWLRIEDQLLAALPQSAGVLFAIRLRVLPLTDVLSNNAVRRGIHRAFATMPEDVAQYKGLGAVRERVLSLSD